MSYLIFGGKGQLGSKFGEIFSSTGEKFSSYDYDKCDIADINSVLTIVKNDKPKVILNCAAYNLVDEAEKDSIEAYKVNQFGTRNIAIAARETGAFLVHYSTDYVFDGLKGQPYIETDNTNPINQYGMSKLKGEEAVLEILEDYLIFRLSWVYGNGNQNFIYKLNQWATNKKELNITDNEFSIPTSVNLISNLSLKALKKKLAGLFHLTPNGQASRLDWAQEIVKLKNLDVQLNPVPIEFFNLPAKRPYNTAMDNNKLSSFIRDIPDWKQDLTSLLEF